MTKGRGHLRPVAAPRRIAREASIVNPRMVATYALELDATTNDAMAAPAGRPLRAVADQGDDARAPLPGTDLRVRLASLPVPLRVTAGDQRPSGIAIEAELPWLAIGTALDLELPDGGWRGGRIDWFEVDVTPAGSACLRILADLSSSATGETIEEKGPSPAVAPGLRAWLAPLVFVAAASIGVYAGLRVPALRSMISAARLLGGLTAGL
jgi:hypothetical protein